MRLITLTILLITTCTFVTKGQDTSVQDSVAQDTTLMVWKVYAPLEVSDFKSGQSGLRPGSFQYTAYGDLEMQLTYTLQRYDSTRKKESNSVVQTVFRPYKSTIAAPDQEALDGLLAYIQLQFDMTEVYSRKLRKMVSERKKLKRSYRALRVAFDRLNDELFYKLEEITQETHLGGDLEKMEMYQREVALQLDLLKDFCDSCPPPAKTTPAP